MRFRKCMTAVTLAGIFLAGIGAGVGFVEFCGFEYQGNVVLGEEATEETRLVWELGDEKFSSLHPYIPDRDTENITVEKDAKVPKDEVWFDVSYNAEYGEPYLETYEEYGETWSFAEESLDGEEKEVRVAEKLGYAHIWTRSSVDMGTEAEVIMEIKDRILKELKEKKFSTYSYPRIFSVEVRVNPSNYKLIEI